MPFQPGINDSTIANIFDEFVPLCSPEVFHILLTDYAYPPGEVSFQKYQHMACSCRFRYNKCCIATFLAIAFIFSILSSLDCAFVIVDVGFSPVNIPDQENNASTFGLGIWTKEDPSSKGFCVMPMFLNSGQSLTTQDDIYNSFVVSDTIFSAVRFIAMFGFLFGLLDLVSIIHEMSFSRADALFKYFRHSTLIFLLNILVLHPPPHFCILYTDVCMGIRLLHI